MIDWMGKQLQHVGGKDSRGRNRATKPRAKLFRHTAIETAQIGSWVSVLESH